MSIQDFHDVEIEFEKVQSDITGAVSQLRDTMNHRMSALESHDHSELVWSINALVERVRIIDKNVEEDWKRFEHVREFLFCGKCHGSGSIWTGQRIETCPDCEGKAYINVADLLKRVKAVEERQENHELLAIAEQRMATAKPEDGIPHEKVLEDLGITREDIDNATDELAPAPQQGKREWIRPFDKVWAMWDDRPTPQLYTLSELNVSHSRLVGITSYIEGEPAPKPPEVE